MLWHKIQGAGGTLGGGGAGAAYIDGDAISGYSSFSLSRIGGLSEGHTVIAVTSEDAASHSLESSGWSGMLGNFPNSSSVNSISSVIAYKVMGASVDTSVRYSRVVDNIAAVAFSGIGTPPSGVSSYQSTSGSTFTVPNVTVSTAGSTLLVAAMIDDDNATITSVPSGYTLADQTGRSGGSLAIMYQLDVQAGSTGSLTGSWSSSDALVTIIYIIPPP